MEDSKSSELLEHFYLRYGFSTRALHAGEHLGQPPQSRNHTNAIFQTSTFVFQNAEEGKALFEGAKKGYIYSRMGNPTVLVLEAKINALEGKEAKLRDPENIRVSTVAFPSGMAAISSTCLAILGPGDTVIRGDVLYGCSDDLFTRQIPRYQINVHEVDTSDLNAFQRMMEAHPKTKLVFFETPTNPTMKVTDIASLCDIAHGVNPDVLVAVDNTFATPYLQRPLALGADIVLHSTTKYICGHGTVVGGVVTTINDKFKDHLYDYMKDIGPVPSPFDSWLVNLGLKTLPLRMERHCSNAMAIARFLERHPKVSYVAYPGLQTSPYHDLARKQMSGFGGMIAFELVGGYEAGVNLMNNARVFTLAVSLGCVDSLIQHPASMTHASVEESRRLKAGITSGLVRLSVGIEDLEDLIQDLDQALSKV
ncbi:trans-sulfuration enzyme family protein [Acidobacteriota bacterium]